MVAERGFSACTDYAPVPAGLFKSLPTQVGRLTKIESTPTSAPTGDATHTRCVVLSSNKSIENKEIESYVAINLSID
ncbi:hypothetical protein J6590_097717 [Homalodisca vitripennis]|nr:hypothetical protein J6590_097717 [Homalodisca vitripennis]